jgi:hypothetical protein
MTDSLNILCIQVAYFTGLTACSITELAGEVAKHDKRFKSQLSYRLSLKKVFVIFLSLSMWMSEVGDKNLPIYLPKIHDKPK